MRFTSLYSLTALAGYALAEDAYLWTFDHGAAKYANTQASSISSDTASSIIARRRGMTDDQHLAGADSTVLQDVQRYGGYQLPLHASSSDSAPNKLLIRISGYTGTVSNFPSLPDLWIEDASKDLADGFKARKEVDGVCEYDLTIPTKGGVDLVYSYRTEGESCMSVGELKIQPTILALFSSVPTANDVSKNLHSLMRTLSHLSVTANLETTLLVLPPATQLHKIKSGRQASASEQPFEFEDTKKKTKSDSSSSTSASGTSSASTSSRSTSTAHPLPKFVPQCFESQEKCDNTTNLCSGHGSCYKAHNKCFKCKCGTTVVRVNKDGSKKTVQWGGNACQKKDISTEFILFAGFGIVMAALIAGAIGAMYQMGAEELPSVLGAGVGGPSKK